MTSSSPAETGDLLYPPGTSLTLPHGQIVTLPMGLPHPQYVLRDLPGIASLVPHLNPRPWSPEEEALQGRVDAVSVAIFGITEQDTGFNEEMPEDEDEWQRWATAEHEWEKSLDLEDEPFPEARACFEFLGWDVTDGQGEEHPALWYFARQILCAAWGRVGHLPGEEGNETTIAIAAEAWGGGLEDAAEAWRRRKGGRS